MLEGHQDYLKSLHCFVYLPILFSDINGDWFKWICVTWQSWWDSLAFLHNRSYKMNNSKEILLLFFGITCKDWQHYYKEESHIVNG